MAKLLKGKRVFLDTTEFSDARFDMCNPAFTEFLRLCKKRQLVLLTTDITRREIKVGIKLLAEKAHQTVRDAAQAIHNLQEPEVSSVKDLARKLKPSAFSDVWSLAVEGFFSECPAVILPMPRTAIEEVFDLYFERQPPFCGSKKAEFPDAFVLQAIEAAANRSDDCIYVISNDSDFEAACQGSPKLVHLKSLSHLLDRVHEHDAAARQVNETIQKNFKRIKKELEKILKSLPPELRDAKGTATLNSVCLDDVLDTLIASCDGGIAAVDFVCHVAIKALVELAPEPENLQEYRGIDQLEVISITLVFRFDPQDTNMFEVLEIWAPTALSIYSHG